MNSGSVDVLDAVVGEEFQVLNEVKNKVGLQVHEFIHNFKRCIGFKVR